jgi:hypothetical protein
MKETERIEHKRKERLELTPAYRSLDLINEKGKPVFSQEQGERQLKELAEGDAVMQPLYYEEVDHHIEEVGIMAIKEVKYVTEKEWEKMIEMQKNHQEIWKYLESISRYEKRFQIANAIPRNPKGQFVSKSESPQTPQKTQQIKKRGRPRKTKTE